MKTHANDQAFAAMACSAGGDLYEYGGLTKREWFAGMAMQGLLRNEDLVNRDSLMDQNFDIFGSAIVCADAIIMALNGGDSQRTQPEKK